MSGPYYTIWVQRPADDEPWCWGGEYASFQPFKAVRADLERLRAQYPKFGWAYQKGFDRDNPPRVAVPGRAPA